MTEGFKIDVAVITMPEGREQWLPPVYARDRALATAQLEMRFKEWATTN